MECVVRNEPVRHRNQQLAPIDPKYDHIKTSQKKTTTNNTTNDNNRQTFRGTCRRRDSHPVNAIDFPTPKPIPMILTKQKKT